MIELFHPAARAAALQLKSSLRLLVRLVFFNLHGLLVTDDLRGPILRLSENNVKSLPTLDLLILLLPGANTSS